FANKFAPTKAPFPRSNVSELVRERARTVAEDLAFKTM
ncbi:hypothetical protein PSYPI_48340, partial [Pseudomonas syringae pv. pisi str. 1704B]